MNRPGQSVSCQNSDNNADYLRSRRDILEATLKLVVVATLGIRIPESAAAGSISVSPVDGPHSDTAASTRPATPDEVDLEIAALGAALKTADPEKANVLVAEARISAGIPSGQRLSWAEAQRAREILTEPERIAQELQNDQLIFVEGWPLAYSEAGVALLFAEIHASSQQQKPEINAQ